MASRVTRARKDLPPPPTFTGVRFVESKSLVPDVLGDEIFVVGSLEHPKWVVLRCPCGQGHQIDVPLMKSVRPHWRLRLDPYGRASLYPSISVPDDPCSSHFWLRSNAVEWAFWEWELAEADDGPSVPDDDED